MCDDRPSSTALLIAKAMVLLDHEPALRELVPRNAAAWYERFITAAEGEASEFVRRVGSRWYRRFLWAIEGIVLPGILVHYALRKQQIETAVRAALDDGYRRVVVLGAGFDTLALRLASEFSGVRFLEIDHPATQRVKRTAHSLCASPHNVEFESLDLAEADAVASLAELIGEVINEDTVVIAEAVLMYLTPERVDALLATVRSISSQRVRLIFTFMRPRVDGSIGFHPASWLVDGWLARRGEPMRWGVEVEAMPRFLRTRGFRIDSLCAVDEVRQRFLPWELCARIPPLAGELTCVAQSSVAATVDGQGGRCRT